MGNEFLFYTQIISIVSYVGTLFYVYKILVAQKDATIELLKEKNDFLKRQIDEMKDRSPNILVERLKYRITGLEDELARLSKNEEKNKRIIIEKENQLEMEKEKLEQLKEQIEKFKDLTYDYFCPNCESPLISREFRTEQIQGMDLEHEYIEFECGRKELDGNVISGCCYPQNGNPQVYFCYKGSKEQLALLKNELEKEFEILSFKKLYKNEKYAKIQKICVELKKNIDGFNNFKVVKKFAKKLGVNIYKPR